MPRNIKAKSYAIYRPQGEQQYPELFGKHCKLVNDTPETEVTAPVRFQGAAAGEHVVVNTSDLVFMFINFDESEQDRSPPQFPKPTVPEGAST